MEMAAKSSDWRPGPTVCRCCLAEGCYKDISTEYFWMGKREVYAEMLSETLNLSIAYAQSGPNSNSRLICEPCISRLRDAAEFKRQVIECEKTFMNYLDPGSTSVQKEVLMQIDSLEEVKIERVKQEKVQSDDDDFDDTRVDFVIENDDDDDLDNEPLMKLASKVPKKEIDLQDLLDNTELTIKRKTTGKSKEPPAKKKKIVIKPSASKSTASVSKEEKKKKENKQICVVRRNARTIIECATAYPFKLPENSMVCALCAEEFDDPSDFRRHMHVDHHDFKMYSSFFRSIDYSPIKVDCTDLKCRICSRSFDSLLDIAKHLNIDHKNNNIDLNHDLGLITFKIDMGKYCCATCGEKFANIRLLSKHSNSHHVCYTCEACGKSYAFLTSLQSHVRNACGRSIHMRYCRRCKKSFSTVKERMDHLMLSKRCCRHLCNICSERFPTWNMKQKHMIQSHCAPARTYPCPECGIEFEKNYKLNEHFKVEHTKNHLKCNFCGQKFVAKTRLKRHLVSHTGMKQFQCDVCSKFFSSKSALRQHMWIHSEIKQYTCKICDKHFNQRVGWKTHIKSRHPELCDF